MPSSGKSPTDTHIHGEDCDSKLDMYADHSIQHQRVAYLAATEWHWRLVDIRRIKNLVITLSKMLAFHQLHNMKVVNLH